MNEKRILVYVGAHMGNGLANYVHLYDEIYAFEANSRFCEVLRNRFSANPNVNIINAAVCEKHNDYIDFNISKNNGDSSSILRANQNCNLYNVIESVETFTINTVNIRKFLEERNIKKIKTYVSDAQGYDFIILKTLKDMIDQGLIEEIQCEVEKNETPTIYVNETKENQNKISNFDDFLQGKYVKAATGWGVLTDGVFESVPEDWNEFDAKWKLISS